MEVLFWQNDGMVTPPSKTYLKTSFQIMLYGLTHADEAM
jgi:hypothetical protein